MNTQKTKISEIEFNNKLNWVEEQESKGFMGSCQAEIEINAIFNHYTY